MTARLSEFEPPGPGTDAERRVARWLAKTLSADGQRARIEPFWCRPNWALAHAWHVAVALAGSLLSVSHPTLGAILLAVALGSIVADALLGISPGRRLTPERASQNVVVEASRDDAGAKTSRLIVTANYDAGRSALMYRDALRRPAASLRRLMGPIALGWLGCLSLAIVWLLAIALIRITTHNPPGSLGAIQLPPSVALVLALALLLEAAGAGYGAAAGEGASGVAAAVAIVRALTEGPPRNLRVVLVLQGAGEGHEIGMRRFLRAHRGELSAGRAIVLGVAPCGAGGPRWWRSDGRLIPIPYTRRLRELAGAVPSGRARETAGAVASGRARETAGAVASGRARETARAVATGRARAHRGRGGTPALPARLKGLPAITIGTLDPRGLPDGAQGRIDPASLDRATEFGLALVEAIDAALEPDSANARGAATPA